MNQKNAYQIVRRFLMIIDDIELHGFIQAALINFNCETNYLRFFKSTIS